MNARRLSSRASAWLLILLLTLVAACNAGQPTAATPAPTIAPTQAAQAAPTSAPTTVAPTTAPTTAPAAKATDAPTAAPSSAPTQAAKAAPTQAPPTAAPPTTAPTAIPPSAVPPTTAPAAPAKLNLNTTPGNDFLTKIPGFSARMVREFEEYRPYVSIQQFRREMGKYVNAQQVAEYEKYVFVPINRNQADAATLQQIPGLDANEAAQLIAGRPFASNDVFLEQVAKFVSPDELAIARTYLSTP